MHPAHLLFWITIPVSRVNHSDLSPVTQNKSLILITYIVLKPVVARYQPPSDAGGRRHHLKE